MKFAFAIVAVAASFLTTSAPASAATVAFTATLDLSAPTVFQDGQIYSHGTGAGFSGLTPALVSPGDTVQITYTFAGGVGISAGNVSFGWANVLDLIPGTPNTYDGGPPENINMTGTFSLLNSSGQAIFTTSPLTDTENGIHIGQTFGVGADAIVFYGVRYNGVLTSSEPSIARTYNVPGLQLSGGRFTLVDAVGAVPEPSTWAMMILGFTGVGYMTYRRRKVAALAV
jgi:hypothetical protein